LNYIKDIFLEKSTFYQFHFQKSKIKLQDYLFQITDEYFPTEWKLEISLNGIDWYVIHKHNINPLFTKKNKVMDFKCKTLIPISFFRLTFLKSANKYWIRFQAFEIFGEIVGDNSLAQFISLLKQINWTAKFSG
jgi:hypothetical protein